jgi:hypothetical protein
MWWKPGAMLEVTIIILGHDRENWNDFCLMFRTPPGRGVGRIGKVIALLSLLTSSIVYKIWLKGTSIKASKEAFSFNFAFPLEAIFHLPPSTYVFTKLARFSMKAGSIFSFKGISKAWVLSFK